ncbi:MAG: DM13 domain-containing protein, partial [Pseudomonadota bacterium]
TFTSGITSGSVQVMKSQGQWMVTFGEDFIHDGAPDPWIALGKDGFQRHGIIGELKQFKGAQSYPIGEKLNPEDFNEVYIWCVEHNTSLGRAKLVWQ